MAKYPEAGRDRSKGRPMQYTVIYETTTTGYSATTVSGVVAIGR